MDSEPRKHIVTVEFTVSAEETGDLSSEEAAVEATQEALAQLKYAPNTLIQTNLTDYVVRRVD
jgi:hypothetical protein